jgi:hypothetical protein
MGKLFKDNLVANQYPLKHLWYAADPASLYQALFFENGSSLTFQSGFGYFLSVVVILLGVFWSCCYKIKL